MNTTAPRRISRGSLVIPRSFGDLVACAAGLGSYLVLGLVALVVACTETKSPTGPESNFNFAPQGGARLALGARVVYLGAAKSKPVNFIRLRVYEENTTNVLGSLDKFLDPKISTFDFDFVVSLQGRKLNTKITMELANRDSVTGKETVNYAGRVAQTPLAPGDIRQLEIDLYPGPLSNFDVTAMHIVKPIVAPIEGDSVLATAVVTGGASDTRIEWTTLDSNVVSIDDTGMITTKLPGTARIVAAVGLLADTATMTVKQRLVAVTVTPTTATIKRGDSTTVVGKGVDPRGAEIVGEQVTWSVATDGILGLSPTAGRTIGQRQGVGTITATSVSKPTLKASAAVTVTAPAVPVATITVTPSTQTATALAQTKTYTAVAKDAAGNVLPGVVFQWSSSSTAIATVNASGVATAVAAGNATITAAVEEASGTAAFLVRPPGVQLTVSSGNNQTGTVKTAASAPVVAKVSDAAGNPVAGIAVTFATADTTGVVATASTTSNAQGLASTAWTFGTKAGTQTVTATSVGLVNSPLPFTATVAAGPPSQIVFITQPSTTAANRTAFGTQPVIEVQDQYGNPVKVAGNTITVTVASGGGTLTNATVTTDASGRATFTALTLGGTVGLRSLSFGMTGVPSITAPVTLTAGTAATITIVSGNGGTGKVGTVYSPSPVVLVTDIDGNPVPSTTLTLTPGVGGGTIQPGTISTGPDGKATISGWTLKPTPGTDTLTVSTPGGSPVKIIVTADPNPATQIAINGGSTSGQIGTALAVPPSVIVRDVNNIPVAGVTVTFAVATGGGTITGATQVTNAQGIATVGSWTLGALLGANTMTATSGTLGGSPLTIAATGLTNAATQMALNGGSTTGLVGQAVATPPSVIIKDANGNPVAGVPVTFSVGTGGGSITGVNQVSDANGIATLGSWKLGGTAGTNTVIATSAGLSGSPMTITATGTTGAATQMALNGGSTTGSVSTAVSVPPSVLVRDANNNPVAGVTVTFAVATGGGTITGATATTNANGIATVGSWTLGAVAGVNTLTATSVGLTNSPLTISASSVVTGATQMALNGGSTTGTAGQPVATPPSVIVNDANNVPVAGVIVTFAVGTGGGSVTGATQTTNAQGIATVGSWTLGASAGTNTIIATSTGLTNSPLTITATASTAPATQIASYAGSVTGTVGAVVATNPAVIVKDAAGNPVAGVTVTFTVTGGGGSMTGTTQITNAQGIATVGGWTLGTIVGTNTATATSGTLTGSPVTFTVAASASTASQMAINAGNNQTANAGSTLSTAPSVVVKDQYGNVVQGTAVTFAVTAGGGSLTGGAQTTNASGVATVGGWTLGVVAGTNTLTATSTGLTGSPLAITATGSANAASLANSTITASPTSITADGTTTSTLTVQLKDANGQNLTTTGGTVTITKASGPTVVLSAVTDNNNGTYTATVKGTISGTATFSASLGGSALTNVSNPATVTLVPGTATKVAFTAQPTNSGPATPLGTQPQVTIQDANGNTVTGSTAPITLTLTTPAGATLTCTTNPVNATAGVATFAGCQVNLANTYTLTAASSGLTSATSSAFTIAAGTATKLVVTTQPSASSVAATAFAQQPVVTIQDAQGNTVTSSTAAVTLALTTGTGTLSGTATVNAVAGVATFSGLNINLTGTDKVLTATSAGLTSATTSPAFTITAGAATKVVYTTQPSASTAAGAAFAQQPVVTIQDAQGNTVTSSTAAVTLALTTGTGTLSGTATVNAVAGVATFSGLSINLTGTDKVLTATATSLTSATTSPAFTITAGTATKVAVTTQPSASTVAGTAFAQQPVVTIQDAQGNTVNVTDNVTVALTTGTGTLSGTATVAAVAGVATFSGLSINLVGTDKVLTATSGTLTSATTSPAFTITAGTKAKVAFTTQPSASTVAGTAFAQQPVVTIQDAQGNTVSVTDNVTVALTTGTGTLSGTATVAAVAGVATFSGLKINLTGTDKVLTATSGTLTSATTSPAFTITAGALDHFSVTKTDSSALGAQTAGTSFNVMVRAQDVNNNLVTSFTGTVDMTTSSLFGVGGGTTGAFTSGVLSSLAVTLNRAGTNQTLTATRTSGGTETGTATFNVNVGAYTKLQLLVPGETAAPGTGSGKTGTPSDATAGTALATVIVNAVDANWNVVTTVADQVSFGTTDGNATIPAAAFLSSGTRTYSNSLTLKTAGNQTVTVSDLTDVNKTANTSPNILVVAGAATKYIVTANPASGVAADRVTVSAQLADANGNAVSTSGVTVNWTSNVGAFGVNGLQVASSTTNASGIATVVDTLHSGTNTTTATDGSARTGNVSITAAGAATKLVGSVSNGARVVAGGSTMTLTAQVTDASGNAVAQAGVPVKFQKSLVDATSGYLSATGVNDVAADPTVSVTINTDATGKAVVTYTSGNAVLSSIAVTVTTTQPGFTSSVTLTPSCGCAVIARPQLFEVGLTPSRGSANVVSGTVVVNGGSIIPAQFIQNGATIDTIAVQAKLKSALGGTQSSLSSRTVTWTCTYEDDGSSCNGSFNGGNTSTLTSGQTTSKQFFLTLAAADTAGRRYVFTATDGSGAVAGLSTAPTGASGSPFVGSATVERGITKIITGTVQNQTGSSPSVAALNFTTANATFPNAASDVLLAVLTFRGRTNSNDPRVGPGDGTSGFITSVPTGWTLLRKDVTADPNDLVTYVYTKIRGASAEPATTTFGFSNQGYGAGVMFSMRGADTTTAGANLIDVSSGQANASGTSFSTPSITTTHAKEKVLAIVTVDADGTGQQFTVPSGWTLVAKSDQTANSPMPTFIVIQRNAQTTGSVSATVTGTTAGVSIGTIIAVKQNTVP